jgi:flagellin-like hook-associated protein FlgL
LVYARSYRLGRFVQSKEGSFVIDGRENQPDVRSLEPVVGVRIPRQVDLSETLLDRIEEAQQQIADLNADISLLQTERRSLDLISRNLSKIRRLTLEKNQYADDSSVIDVLNDRLHTLLKANRHLVNTRFNGYALFKDSTIELSSRPASGLCLMTTEIPQIKGTESDDLQSTLVSLDAAATAINQEYKRISSVMRELLNYYQQLRSEIDTLIFAQGRFHLVD